MKKPLLLFLLTHCFCANAQSIEYKQVADSLRIMHEQYRKALAYNDSINEDLRLYKHKVGTDAVTQDGKTLKSRLEVQAQNDAYRKTHSEYRRRHSRYLPVLPAIKPYTTRSIPSMTR
jgi:hypothetical protein